MTRSAETDPDPGAYAPAAHTATVSEDDTRYVVDLRDSRVWRLTGVAAVAWEWVLGAVSSEEAAAFFGSEDEQADAAAVLRALSDCCQTLAEAGFLVRIDAE